MTFSHSALVNPVNDMYDMQMESKRKTTSWLNRIADDARRMTVSFTPDTLEKIDDIAIEYREKRGPSLVRMIEHLQDNPQELQEFSSYCSENKKLNLNKNREKDTKTSVLTNFVLKKTIIAKLEDLQYGQKYVDRSHFIRTMIMYFHDRINKVDPKKVEKALSLLKKGGINADHRITIDGQVYLRLD